MTQFWIDSGEDHVNDTIISQVEEHGAYNLLEPGMVNEW